MDECIQNLEMQLILKIVIKCVQFSQYWITCSNYSSALFFLSDNDLYILSNLFLSCFLFVQSCVDLKQTKKNAECPCIIFDVFDVTPHCHAYKSLLSCLSRFHFLF